MWKLHAYCSHFVFKSGRTHHMHKRTALACHQCSLQGIVSIGTDGKPVRVRQHINSGELKAVNSKSGFDHWKRCGKGVFTLCFQCTVFALCTEISYVPVACCSVFQQKKTGISFNPAH